MKKIAILLALSCLFTVPMDIGAQTPQYYNYQVSGGANSFPFNVSTGKRVQWLVRAGTLNQPSPAPPGNITTLWFYMAGAATDRMFTNLTIKLGLTTLTSLPTGVVYTGPMDTVYFRASVTLSSSTSTWMSITLDRPFTYDNTMGLVIDVQQCGYTPTTGTMTVNQATGTPVTRNYLTSGPCPQSYSGQDGTVANCGIDILAAGIPRYYNTAWCTPGTPYPNIPSATIHNACAWLGDSLYMHTPDASGNATTTMRIYTLGGSWSTGVPLPVPKTQGTLTAAAGKLYYIGGSATPGGSGSPDVYEFDRSSGIWTLKAPLPGSTQGHGAGKWGDSVIFVIMGPWNTPTTACYFYRIGNNTTGTTTAFTGTATRSHATGLWGNKIYVAGGYGTTFSKQFYIGTIGPDASTISWTAGPPFPSVPKAALGGTAVGDRFYVVGGNNSVGSISSDTTMIWHITAGVWGFFSGIKPVAVHNVQAAVTYKLIGDTAKIFCPGGSSGTGTTLNFDVIACGPTVSGIDPVKNKIPQEYALLQNYPNPFNPRTVIRFQLPVVRSDRQRTTNNVQLLVFDVLGREVQTLVNEELKPGTYAVEWDGTDFPSGIYFYKLTAHQFGETGEFTDTKKMLLIK